MRQREQRLVVAFATTTAAMKLEKEAALAGLEGRLIPLPPVISAGCGLAFCTDLAEKEKAEHFLEQQQLAFYRVPGRRIFIGLCHFSSDGDRIISGVHQHGDKVCPDVSGRADNDCFHKKCLFSSNSFF